MIQLTRLRAFAILGPNASAREARAFESSRCPVSIWNPSDDIKSSDAVLVFGGDGTVHRHLAMLAESAVPVLVVPHGSGNDFARSLGIVNRTQAGLLWRRFCSGLGTCRTIDLGVIRCGETETLFCCVASAGLDGEANRRANNFPRWLRARGGYLLAGVISALTFPARHFQIRGTRESGFELAIDEKGFFVACANTPFYGDGLRIAPGARLDDGLLDLCFVRAMSRTRLLLVARTVISGAHVKLPAVEYVKVSRVTLTPDPLLPVFADGEPVGETPAEISVRRNALRVIVRE